MLLPLPDGRSLDLTCPRIMGILNVTPDSFSDGGTHAAVEPAVDHARRMIGEGADLIDIGGESTRPGSRRVDAEEQKRRVLPVVERIAALGKAHGEARVVISIDTTLAAVAEAALDAGAEVINDISAGRDDPRILGVAAARRAPIVLMHMQGTPETMQVKPSYHDVAAEVEAFLRERIDAALRAGVRRERIVIDPGIGFGKTREHNLALLRNLGRFVALGQPVLLGASRKRFMGSICRVEGTGEAPRPPEPHELVGATCATTALGVAAGVRLFRVHDVRENRQAADVAWAIGGA